MGDINEQFTKEELVTLGEVEAEPSKEAPEEAKEPEKAEATEEKGSAEVKEPETEQAAEPTESATEGKEETQEDEEDLTEPVKVQKRINKLTWERRETERKLDLLKRLGPDKYFEVYPDEKPKDSPPPQTAKVDRVLSFSEALNLRVNGGTYDGKTLAEVYQENPVIATDMYIDLRDKQRDAIAQANMSQVKLREESEKEITTFSRTLSKEMFEKDFETLTEDDGKRIEVVIADVLDWMEKTGRGGGRIEDAYFLMNKENLIKNAKSDGAKSLVKNLKQGSVASVKGQKDGAAKKTGYEAYDGMSDNQFRATINSMTDKTYRDFINKAPQSLKEKFPKVDWAPLP
jgi:hypothetical protein